LKILAVYNIKGGVGKTTTAVNLAWLSAREGARTLVWDLDPQGAASFYFRIRPKVKGVPRLIRRRYDPRLRIRGTDFEGLDLLPADFSYRNLDLLLSLTKKPRKRLGKLLRPLKDAYDHVLLDCAPSISLVSEGVFVASDALIVPTIPTTLSMRTLEQLTLHLESMKSRLRPQVLPFFCMVDQRRSLHRSLSEPEASDRVRFLRTRIPASSVVERMGVQRAPLATYARGAAPARAYEDLWKEIKERLYTAEPDL
jgi:cellulose biosynthesis protein BcsQ